MNNDKTKGSADDSDISAACYQEYTSLIHKLTGIQLRPNRESMLQGRLRRRLRALDLKTYEEYLHHIKNDAAEQSLFTDLITTNETYFYRTPRIWEHFTQDFLPNWVKNHPNQEFQAWSAAASSGEEAHTLGILCEHYKKSHPSFRYSITGTDISQEMVELCQKGRYSGRSIQSFRQIHPEIFEKYMYEIGTEHQAITEVRNRIKFSRHNLFSLWAGKEKFDLVLLRNVLIYFVPEDQEKVLRNVRAKMNESATLIIGESESLSQMKTEFEYHGPLIYRASAAAKKAEAA